MQKISANGKDYYLKVTTKVALNMEKDLNDNPINVLIRIKYKEEFPRLSEVLVMLHHMLQPLNHGMSFQDTVSLVDSYFEEGGNLGSLFDLILGAFIDCGMLNFEEEDEDSKN